MEVNIDVTTINTQKVTRGKWLGIAVTTKPLKCETTVAGESEFMALHKTLFFFGLDHNKILSKVHNNLGGYTYTLDTK